MTLIARVIGVSLLCSGLGAVLGMMLFGQEEARVFVSLVLGSVGAIVGAVAGSASEIVTMLRRGEER